VIQKRKYRQWPNIYTRAHASGVVGYMVDLGEIDGKRRRHSFKTKAEATTFAELKRIERQNEGAAALALSPAVRQDAAKASAILAPQGVSLLQAAQYYADHVLAYRDAPLVKEVAGRLVEDAEKNDRRSRTVVELRSRLALFAADFEGRRLSDISAEEIEAWIDEDDWSPRTRINYLTKISQLFNYALRRRWVDANIVEQIERPATSGMRTPG
jgi:hypothetical protein